MKKSFWISPLGNDENPGTEEQPFLTLEKARDAVTALQEESPQSDDIIIWIDEGIYRLTAPFVLEAKHSGQNGFRVIYKAVEGTRPEFRGSIPVYGWEPAAHDTSIFVARVAQGTRTRQLYVNGQRAVRARTGDYPEGFVPVYAQGGIAYEPSIWNNEQWRDPKDWKYPDKVEAVAATQWRMMSVPLKKIEANGIISLQEPAWTNANLYIISQENPQPGIWSFWRITRFENDLAFLTDPGEWYLDETEALLYYKPLPGEDMLSGQVQVELPVLETLLTACGTPEQPVSHLVFEGLSFTYATWLEPSSSDGYVSDQSGYRVVGDHHEQNIIGHVKEVCKTPGNIRLEYARHTAFAGNTFTHLGAVALDYGIGSQYNIIDGNTFFDISSAAIQLGDVTTYTTPLTAAQMVSHNTITMNQLQHIAVEFVDAAGIFVGFSEYTTVSYNTIKDVHWSGIAMGWGWGLLDPDGYPGVVGATWYQWGKENYHTVNRHNKILYNHIENFLLSLWDGGSIYTTGYQGTCVDDGLLIEGNVAIHKHPQSGGNIFYTDGGSRWVTLLKNVSSQNSTGYIDFGPAPKDPFVFLKWKEVSGLLFEYFNAFITNHLHYGGDIGGCRTYGDIRFIGNMGIVPSFYDVCQYSYEGVSYPVNIIYDNNNQDALGSEWGGASYPPVNPVTSWQVPRVSLPGIMGLQQDYSSEWWYYVGVVYDEQNTPYSIIMNILRYGKGGLQAGINMLGIGWKEGGASRSLHGLGAGIGASQTADKPSLISSLCVQPVTDSNFGLTIEPLLEFTAPYKNLLHNGIHLNTEKSNWSVVYTGGNVLGAENATYTIQGNGKGYITNAGSADAEASEYEVFLSFTDRKGMVMENRGGVVGNSYECALPVLEVQAGGRLSVNGKEHTIRSGTLWMDRQMLSGTVGGSNAPLSEKSHLLSWLVNNSHQVGKAPLYTGNWMGLTLYNGLSLVLTEFWQPHAQQWISGTMIGRSSSNPQSGGFGNIYFPSAYTAVNGNGGRFLRARYTLGQPDTEWDYDINLLKPENGGINSPHWTSPQTGNTYATAWQIDFSPALKIEGLPERVYLYVLSENTEIVMTSASGYFEGAAFIYTHADGSGDPVGQAFVEQMGYN